MMSFNATDILIVLVRLILQGIRAETHLGVLKQLLRNPATNDAIFSVAYISSAGAHLLAADVSAAAKRVRVFAGVRNGVTSKQGLQTLLAAGAELFVVDTGTQSVTYHPKLYMAWSATEAHLVVGSANMTAGGLNNNIEASIDVVLDLTQPEKRGFQLEIQQQFTTLPTTYPNNVFAITTPAKIEELLETGRLVDEQTAPRAPAGGREPTDDIPPIELLVTHHRPAIIPARPGGLAPVQGAAASSPDITSWELAWTSKPLTERDLNIPTGPTTHRTGSINLDKGLLPAPTDHRHYFRDNVFSALIWNPGTPGIETASTEFGLIVRGVDYGRFVLTLSHSTSTTSPTYLQHNAMTRLRWGQILSRVARPQLLGASLSLLRRRRDPAQFRIDID